MIRSRSQNSFLAVATLGVYLGLILAGATPTVLAQAATAKQFSVKDEVGRRDDLDKKPEGDASALVESIRTYFNEIDTYLTDVPKAAERLQFKYPRDPEVVVPVPCHEVGSANLLFKPPVSGRTLLPILLDPHYANTKYDWNVGCKTLADANANGRFAAITLKLTQKGVLDYQLSVKLPSREQASALFGNLRSAFRNLDIEGFGARQRVLFEATELTNTDNQVIVTTRLPRGSLDTLLASNAK